MENGNMSMDFANAKELINIALEVGAVALDGTLRYPSSTGNWQLGGVDLGEFLEQYRDQQVMLVIAPIGAADPDTVLCGTCGFPLNEAGHCPRCVLATRDQADAFRREIRAKWLLDDIERFLTDLDGEG